MNEACLNLIGLGIDTAEGQALAERNPAASCAPSSRSFRRRPGTSSTSRRPRPRGPASGSPARTASAIRTSSPPAREEPYYTNSTQLPVGCTEDIFDALTHQDALQTLYTGGTVFHGFLGERLDDWRSARLLVRRIAENFHLPYFTISPTFTICPVHGYIPGEHFSCPHHQAA